MVLARLLLAATLLVVVVSWSLPGPVHAPTTVLAAGTPDDGGDWLPAVVPVPLLLVAIAVFSVAAAVPLAGPSSAARWPTRRSRAPPVR